MDPKSKALLFSTLLFVLVGYSVTYNTTEGIFGGIVGQSGAAYGVGNTFSNYGFILHAIVFYVLMKFFVLKNL